MNMVTRANTFTRTVCPICYEDLKPIVEDLQAILICGHVFHELCLQQWFEYCPGGKKCSCPVCKQSCASVNVGRLYFQSVGDTQHESLCSPKKEMGDAEEGDVQLLRGEAERLEAKVSGLNLILERQGKEIKQLNEELYACKDQLKKEVIVKNHAVEEKTICQSMLSSKTEELVRVKLESARLHDRNMALAKELAALKLASDLELEEDEVLKLASFGNGNNNKDTIDVLIKTLAIRNKSYRELITKCNHLGRGEARSSQKLEKAQEKINKLKARVQELETVVEARDNDALRVLRASKKENQKGDYLNFSNRCPTAFSTGNVSLEDQKRRSFEFIDHLESSRSLCGDKKNFEIANNMGAIPTKECTSAVDLGKERNSGISGDKLNSKHSTVVHVSSESDLKITSSEDLKPRKVKSAALPSSKRETKVKGLVNPDGLFSGICINGDKDKSPADPNNTESYLLDARGQNQPMLNIRKELPSTVSPYTPGDSCFSGGLLGPDGSHRHLGKWCRLSQDKGSAGNGSGDLIKVGSDGRGGRIKVLKSLNQNTMAHQENLTPMKRSKPAVKAGGLQSQGCLKMEHFFGRSNC